MYWQCAAVIDLLPNSNQSDCPNTPTNFPIPIWEDEDDFQPGNFSIYDDKTRQTTAILLSFFTNGTLYTGSPFATSQMLCTNPKTIAGSHNPTSTAAVVLRMDIPTLIGVGFAMNALAFLVLWLLLVYFPTHGVDGSPYQRACFQIVLSIEYTRPHSLCCH